MNPIDFRGQRSKVKVTMEIYGNKLVKARGCYALRCYIFNRNIGVGGYYQNNVQIPPFNLRKVTEICENYSGQVQKSHRNSFILLIDIQNS